MNQDFLNNPSLLMQKAREGDTEAFGELYKFYFTPVFRYVYFRVRNKEDAEDLVQAVFLKVFQTVSNFRDKGKNPLAYFMTTARNTLIDHWRKKKDIILENNHEIFTKIPDSARNVQEEAEQRDFSKEISASMKNLTDEQQEIIVLKFFSDLNNKEIAEITGKTEEVVRQMQVRALKALKKYFCH